MANEVQETVSWSLEWNYLQFLLCLRLGVNTKELGKQLPGNSETL